MTELYNIILYTYYINWLVKPTDTIRRRSLYFLQYLRSLEKFIELHFTPYKLIYSLHLICMYRYIVIAVLLSHGPFAVRNGFYFKFVLFLSLSLTIPHHRSHVTIIITIYCFMLLCVVFIVTSSSSSAT